MRSVLVDTSAFLSLKDPDETNHQLTQRTLEDLVDQRVVLLSTNFIFDETYTLLRIRLGRWRALDWGESFRDGKLVRLVRVSELHEERAWEIIRDFSDKDFSYTDATSFAVAESLGIEEAFSLDQHFHQYGKLRVFP